MIKKFKGRDFLSLGDSDKIQRTDKVLELGYPLGQYYLKGATTLCDLSDGTCREAEDQCVEEIEGRLVEEYCEQIEDPTDPYGVLASHEDYDCPNGCSDGACIFNETTST